MSDHTPGLWKVSASTPSLIKAADGRTLAQTFELLGGDSTHDSRLREMWANAQLIVRACNAHNDLLVVVKRIEACMDFDASDNPLFDGLQAQLLAAIAKAEGGAA